MPEPDPPSDLPAYVTDPLARQSPERLREISAYVDELLAAHEAEAGRPLDPETVAAEAEAVTAPDETLVDIAETTDGTRVVKKVPCGRDACSTCPHGPYVYVVTREGDSLNWDYRGRADAEQGEA